MADHTTKTRPRGFLSRELIIKEALALLDEHGPEALSMRRLADRLGVAPTALYTHIRGKADLIEGLIDQVYAGLTLELNRSGDWTQQLTTLSQQIRTHLLDHPAVVPYALQQPGLGPHSLRLGEAIYNVLRPAGFSNQAVVGTVYALVTYILGFVALEVPRASTDPATSTSVACGPSSPPSLPASSPTPCSWPPSSPAARPTTSSSSASTPSSPASTPNNQNPALGLTHPAPDCCCFLLATTQRHQDPAYQVSKDDTCCWAVNDVRMPSKAVSRPAGAWSVLLDLVGMEANPDVDWLVAWLQDGPMEPTL